MTNYEATRQLTSLESSEGFFNGNKIGHGYESTGGATSARRITPKTVSSLPLLDEVSGDMEYSGAVSVDIKSLVDMVKYSNSSRSKRFKLFVPDFINTASLGLNRGTNITSRTNDISSISRFGESDVYLYETADESLSDIFASMVDEF